jgi:TldD protein
VDPPVTLKLDRAGLGDRLRRVSALFKTFPEIFDSQVKMSVDHQTRYHRHQRRHRAGQRAPHLLHPALASSRAKDGLLVNHFKSFYGASEAEMPDEAELRRTAAQLADEVKRLREAPMLDPFNGPAILLPEAAGVFFHEALGHRLEGERQNDNKEGATFKGQIGKPVLPAFVSVLDDPTLRKVGNVSLNGTTDSTTRASFARPVTLVDHGILRNYLKSRTPVKGSLESNGHGRAEGTLDPIGRMASTIVAWTRWSPTPS